MIPARNRHDANLGVEWNRGNVNSGSESESVGLCDEPAREFNQCSANDDSDERGNDGIEFCQHRRGVWSEPGDFASASAAAPVCTVGTPVVANASCNLAFTFKPAATGARTAQVVFTDDANGVSGSTQTLTLNGTGIAPTATVTTTPASSPLAIAFESDRADHQRNQRRREHQ